MHYNSQLHHSSRGFAMNTLDTACGIDVKYVVLLPEVLPEASILQVLVITRRSFSIYMLLLYKNRHVEKLTFLLLDTVLAVFIIFRFFLTNNDAFEPVAVAPY